MCLPQPLSQPLARGPKVQTSSWEAQSSLKTRPPWSKVPDLQLGSPIEDPYTITITITVTIPITYHHRCHSYYYCYYYYYGW